MVKAETISWKILELMPQYKFFLYRETLKDTLETLLLQAGEDHDAKRLHKCQSDAEFYLVYKPCKAPPSFRRMVIHFVKPGTPPKHWKFCVSVRLIKRNPYHQFCNVLFCPHCTQQKAGKRWLKVRAAVAKIKKTKPMVKFLSLTLGGGNHLPEQIGAAWDHLLSCWGQYNKTLKTDFGVLGTYRVFELKRASKDPSRFYLHIHAILALPSQFHANQITGALLQGEWDKVAGPGHSVWVEDAPTPAGFVAYATKANWIGESFTEDDGPGLGALDEAQQIMILRSQLKEKKFSQPSGLFLGQSKDAASPVQEEQTGKFVGHWNSESGCLV
ncbi:MAG: protein rep [Magnetococcus sp. YQC-3]